MSGQPSGPARKGGDVLTLPKPNLRVLVKDMHGFWYVFAKSDGRCQGPYLSKAEAAATGIHCVG